MAPVAWRWETGCPTPFKICQHGLWPVPAGQDKNLHQGPRICMYYTTVKLEFEHAKFLRTLQWLQNDVTLGGAFFLKAKFNEWYIINVLHFTAILQMKMFILLIQLKCHSVAYQSAIGHTSSRDTNLQGYSSTNLKFGTQRKAKLLRSSVRFLSPTFACVWMQVSGTKSVVWPPI